MLLYIRFFSLHTLVFLCSLSGLSILCSLFPSVFTFQFSSPFSYPYCFLSYSLHYVVFPLLQGQHQKSDLLKTAGTEISQPLWASPLPHRSFEPVGIPWMRTRIPFHLHVFSTDLFPLIFPSTSLFIYISPSHFFLVIVFWFICLYIYLGWSLSWWANLLLIYAVKQVGCQEKYAVYFRKGFEKICKELVIMFRSMLKNIKSSCVKAWYLSAVIQRWQVSTWTLACACKCLRSLYQCLPCNITPT